MCTSAAVTATQVSRAPEAGRGEGQGDEGDREVWTP